MPDKRTHRGPHPADEKLFGPENIACLKQALADFSLLLSKGYADKSALKLICDRFSLTERQRLAVMRSACPDEQLKDRKNREVKIDSAAAQIVAVDGYNVLITIEAALSGGVIFIGRDGCFRDLASLHGTYRKVEETITAVKLINDFLKEAKISKVIWLLDSPVSNSGRLKTLIQKLAMENNWNCEVRLSVSPDYELIRSDFLVATSDSAILDGCKKWLNLARALIESKLPNSWIINLS